jgi:hypothetical protein
MSKRETQFIEMHHSGREMIVERAGLAFNMIDLVKDEESFEEACEEAFEEAYNHP